MNYSLFLARRLSLSSAGHRNSPAIKVAVTAVALSIAVMIAAIAIVLGFKREIRQKVVGFNSHITLYAVPNDESDTNLITLTPTLKNILNKEEYITDYSLCASIPAILKTEEDFKGIYLKSIGNEMLKSFITANLEEGKIPDYTKEENGQKILISRIAANQLGLKTGDKIDTYFMTGAIRVRKLEIAGIFNSHFDVYDDLLVYGNLGLIQNLGEISPSQGTSITITVDNFDNISEYSDRLSSVLAQGLASGLLYKYYRVDNVLYQGAGYFRWLSMLDTNVIVILILMTFVACVTLISGLLILILDKKNFIGLIRSLGTPISGVRRVFIYMAIKIAIRGLLIGNILSLGLLFAQDRWHFLHLDPNAYYIDFVPVEITWPSILILNVATILIIYLCLILPSWFAARISPAETMRYE